MQSLSSASPDRRLRNTNPKGMPLPAISKTTHPWAIFNHGLNPETEYTNLDSGGIPRVKYGGELCYNPVTIANFTLSMYGRDLRGDRTAWEKFLKGADRLITMQDSEGAFRYRFPWKYY